MDSEAFSPSKGLVNCQNCGCSCSFTNGSPRTWLRSVKRKYDEFEEGNGFVIPGFDYFSVARVQIENECAALREMVGSQQKAVQDLFSELEEERNASSSAANEAMSMILRLQREKAEIQMEARQFKRFAEEKMAHDQEELYSLEDVLYKREQAIQSLTCEVQAYKHRMMSYGLTEAEVEGERGGISRNPSFADNIDAQFGFSSFEYPPLKCNVNETQGPVEVDNEVVDIEKYAFGETPRDRLKHLEHRIHQMERCPSNNQWDVDSPGGKNILEKVIVGHSPKWPRHSRKFSTDSSNSFMEMGKEMVPDLATDSPRIYGSIKKMDVSHADDFSNFRKLDNVSEIGDDMSDRVYTIDSVHNGVPYNGFTETTTPRESLNQADVDDPYIKKLYMRLQALEADRESMRQAIISMRTDKAQLVLLKEIAQHLCKEMTPESQMPLKKASVVGSFSFMSIVKWTVSFIFWRKGARQSKYMYGPSSNNAGLLMLLDKTPDMKQSRCVSSTQV